MPEAGKTAPIEAMRVDKWLWAARFFKTRALAATAVTGGKVHVDGVRVKPARQVRVGHTLTITRGETTMAVVVARLVLMRGPAPEAQLMYTETDASRDAREASRARRRAERADGEFTAGGRPDKRGRRILSELKRQ